MTLDSTVIDIDGDLTFANERTFLAWARTALALIIAVLVALAALAG